MRKPKVEGKVSLEENQQKNKQKPKPRGGERRRILPAQASYPVPNQGTWAEETPQTPVHTFHSTWLDKLSSLFTWRHTWLWATISWNTEFKHILGHAVEASITHLPMKHTFLERSDCPQYTETILGCPAYFSSIGIHWKSNVHGMEEDGTRCNLWLNDKSHLETFRT